MTAILFLAVLPAAGPLPPPALPPAALPRAPAGVFGASEFYTDSHAFGQRRRDPLGTPFLPRYTPARAAAGGTASALLFEPVRWPEPGGFAAPYRSDPYRGAGKRADAYGGPWYFPGSPTNVRRFPTRW